MKIFYIACFLTFLGFFVGCSPPHPEPPYKDKAISGVRVIEGEYWGLPEDYPKKSPFGGLYQLWGPTVRRSPLIDIYWVGEPWYKLNPSEGEYKWECIEDNSNKGWRYGLNEIGEIGKTAILWVPISDYRAQDWYTGFETPEWVIDKCESEGNPISVIYRSNGEPWGLAVWEDCPRRELTRFIREMFGRYKHDDRLQYAYITTFLTGEFWLPKDVLESAVSKGLTGEVLERFVKDLIDAWAVALGPEKLIWTSASPWIFAFKAETKRINHHALMIVGTQFREGGAEAVSWSLHQPLIGQVWDKDYYLYATSMDEMGKSGLSFYGDEFEIASNAGVFEDYTYYRMAVLNMLRKGINYAIFPAELRDTENDEAHPEFATLRDYFRQSAGYNVKNSPDAWAILQMWYDDSYNGKRKYKNYEKFMIQREVPPDGETVTTEKIVWPPDKSGFRKVGEWGADEPAVTYKARRTDHASGNDYIYFNVDDDFLSSNEHTVQISVFYKDNNNENWRIEYNSLTQDYQQSYTVSNVNDGKWKSAIFTLIDVNFRNSQTGEMDFRIYNGGRADLTVSSVRVIRLYPKNQPSPAKRNQQPQS
jgi:hypothetical protein